MLQNHYLLWIVSSLAGLLCLAVSFFFIYVRKVNAIALRLLAAGLFCFTLWSFDLGLKQSIAGYYEGTMLYGAVFAIFLFSTKGSRKAEEKPEENNCQESLTEIEAKAPTQRVGLSTEQSLRYMQAIADHLSSTLAFRRPGYTIRDLAGETGIPGYMISLFINQEYGMNFNEFINAYRVEYLARIFNTSFDHKAYTLEALGKMAGFNSRTAFIASIKKHTGMTPSTFFGRKPGENVIPVTFKVPALVRDVA